MAWNWGKAGSGAVSGAGIGSTFGPVGTAVGGGIGGLLGGLTGGKGQANAPDFRGMAQAQSDSSRPFVNTPWGQQSWTVGPDGRPQSNFTLPGDAGSALQNIQANMLRSSQYDPTQARDQAVNQNLQYGMGVLQPQLGLMDQSYKSNVANTGSSPQQQLLENKLLSDKQASLVGNVYNNALNMGNQTQQTQMQQMNQPFNQYASLIGSSLQQPNLGQPANFLGAAALDYGASRNQAAAQQGQKQGMLGGAGSLLQGKGGGGGGGIPLDYNNPGTFGTAGGI